MMYKTGVSYLLILLAVSMLSCFIFSDGNSYQSNVQAKDGVLDLSGISKDDEVIALSGEWKFAANRYLNSTDSLQNTTLENVPGPWSADADYGTYQLKILLPDHFREIGIRVRNIWSAHRLSVDGEVLAIKGTLATTKEDTEPSNRAYEVYLKPTSKTLVITLQVADFYNARHGVIFPIDLGVAETIAQDVSKDIFLEQMAVSILLIFSIFHFCLFVLRTKDHAFFYSALYFFLLAFLVLFRGERLLQREFPIIPFEVYFRLQDFTTYFSAVIFVCFLNYTIKTIMKRRTLLLLTMPLILYGGAILVFPARSLSSLQYIFFGYMNGLAVILIVRLVYLFLKEKAETPKNEVLILSVCLVGLLLFAGSGAFDQLFFSGRNILNRLGLFLFILSMNVFLAIRLINRTTEAEVYSERLEKVTIGKDSFLEVTTNELEQPLYHALNLTKSLSTVQALPEHRLLEQQLERLLYLVNDLKDFMRIRFHDLQIKVQPVNIQMILQHVIKLHERTLEKGNAELYSQIDCDLLIIADEQRVSQIIYRIFGTTVAHAENGNVFVSLMHLDREVRISIEGTGPEIKHRIAADETGQSIGQTIIEQMGGTFTVNPLQNGIRFILTLPFFGYDERQENQLKHLPLNLSPTANSELPKLLIVEDDFVHAEVLRSMLSSHYAVQLVRNPEVAMLIILEKPPVMILIDEVMPGVDGLTLTKKIRKHYSYIELPIIMLVANEYPTNISLVLESGANDYVRKPTSKETLLARLSTIALTKELMNKAVEHEMAFLQAQIKPHFLYNALSNIISFCYTDGERAGYLLSMLSTYLRYIFDSSKEGHHTTLERELEIIRAYVEIEQVRFGNRLHVQFQIDLSIDKVNVEVPALLIQPLVENAIRHGIFEKEGTGCVIVHIYRNHSMLEIHVIDDGVGMSEGQVAALSKGENSNSDGIGFSNVQRRIKDLPSASLTIQSILNKGTTIILKLPFKENKDVENHIG